jgi:hypothetical protein
MCSLRFENNLLNIEGVCFTLISKKIPLSKLSFGFVSISLPLLPVTEHSSTELGLLIQLSDRMSAVQHSGNQNFLCREIAQQGCSVAEKVQCS